METKYTAIAKLTKEEEIQLKYLQAKYNLENLNEKITIQKTIAKAINYTFNALKGVKKNSNSKKKNKNMGDLESKILSFFVKSDKYIDAKDVIDVVGDSISGKQLGAAMRNLEIDVRRGKKGMQYAVIRKN